jgi:hypothetical protein
MRFYHLDEDFYLIKIQEILNWNIINKISKFDK